MATNRYYTKQVDVNTGDTVRASTVNDQDDGTNAAFDLVQTDVDNAINVSTANTEKAQAWAETAVDSVVPGEPAGSYSSLHYSVKSTDQATIATDQATVATDQATIATDQATIATDQATLSQGYAEDSNNSANLSESSANSSSTEAQAALASENAAKTSENNASNSAADAAASAAILPNIITGDSGKYITINSSVTGYDKKTPAEVAVDIGVPIGTVMLFKQATAPLGWTQDVSLNDYMLRVVAGAGGSTGGTDSPILMNKVPTHSHSANSSTTGNHTHNHYYAASHTNYSIDDTYGVFASNNTYGATSGAGDHSHTITVDNNSGGSNWTPKYVDTIICTKD